MCIIKSNIDRQIFLTEYFGQMFRLIVLMGIKLAGNNFTDEITRMPIFLSAFKQPTKFYKNIIFIYHSNAFQVSPLHTYMYVRSLYKYFFVLIFFSNIFAHQIELSVYSLN